MMHDGWMWGMGWLHLIGALLVVLVMAALIKYVEARITLRDGFCLACVAPSAGFCPCGFEDGGSRRRSTVAKVKEIRLGFSEGVNPKFSGIDLKDQNGEKVAIGPAALDPKNTKELVVEVSEKLSAGSYTVEWHAVSDDTHRIKGQYSFKVTQ